VDFGSGKLDTGFYEWNREFFRQSMNIRSIVQSLENMEWIALAKQV